MQNTTIPPTLVAVALLQVIATTGFGQADDEATDGPAFVQQVAPILDKYCVGCHNSVDKEGGLSLETFAEIGRGGEHGPALLAGSAATSRIVRVLTGEAEPRMPPEDNEAPTAAEIEILRKWIDGGARGPEGEQPDRRRLITPEIPAAEGDKAVTAVAWSPDGKRQAVARYRTVRLIDVARGDVERTISDVAGKINSLSFSTDGRRLVVASGVTGLYGQATIHDCESDAMPRVFTGHRDTLYAAALSPDGKRLATGGYDREIVLWDVESGEATRTIKGHNGAVFDLAFSPCGTVLASASGDETIKLWRIDDGQRLDTLSQPLAEQYVVAFSPDGRYVLAGGADNRIRVWQFVSKQQPRINPLLHARFAHEGPVVQLVVSLDGKALLSASEDRSLKLWETTTFTQSHAFETQSDLVAAIAVSPSGDSFRVGRMDGTSGTYDIEPRYLRPRSDESPDDESVDAIVAEPAAEPATLRETEPNDQPSDAVEVPIPATIAGAIAVVDDKTGHDADLFRFRARRGERVVLEVNAARRKSPLDSKIEVLDEAGRPIERVLLRAVRDSYFTFRGKDSDTSDDFRLHNWREMELNEYLYANGEVVKLWLYPRGPDSGFKVYPGQGERYTYFGTTAIAHALHEPCYVVEPHPPGTRLIPNGLPTFSIHYENDDDGRRELGTDSKLTFIAPEDGTYLARLTDSRGFQGESFEYELIVRRPRPDFKVTLHGAGPNVNRGSGKEFHVRADRLDGFDGEIRVDVTGVPPGFHVTTPLVIQAGHETAHGVIYADEDAEPPLAEKATASVVAASATIEGREVRHEVNNLGEIKLSDAPKLVVHLELTDESQRVGQDGVPELVVAPGETITAKVVLERRGFDGIVSFGKEDSGRNLPHGVYVDNIGLNGLMILQGSSERTFFITAANWVPETTRLFHLNTGEAGGQASRPIRLRVRGLPDVVASP